jgi:2-iminobutanoate/2-iminopropanoate deaminase
MDRAAVTSAAAPAPAGPYSPALQVGDWLFLSGQGGFGPATGALQGATIEEQTEQTFRNISALLEAAGLDLGDVVSCLVHLSDLSLFGRFNTVYERQFAAPRPVAGMLVEVTVVAHRRARRPLRPRRCCSAGAAWWRRGCAEHLAVPARCHLAVRATGSMRGCRHERHRSPPAGR